jgi:hypothetical protein
MKKLITKVCFTSARRSCPKWPMSLPKDSRDRVFSVIFTEKATDFFINEISAKRDMSWSALMVAELARAPTWSGEQTCRALSHAVKCLSHAPLLTCLVKLRLNVRHSRSSWALATFLLWTLLLMIVVFCLNSWRLAYQIGRNLAKKVWTRVSHYPQAVYTQRDFGIFGCITQRFATQWSSTWIDSLVFAVSLWSRIVTPPTERCLPILKGEISQQRLRKESPWSGHAWLYKLLGRIKEMAGSSLVGISYPPSKSRVWMR